MRFFYFSSTIISNVHYGQHYSLQFRVLHVSVLTWPIFLTYFVLNMFCSQCLCRFLKEFSVPANTMLDGKLFQLFVTLSKKCVY